MTRSIAAALALVMFAVVFVSGPGSRAEPPAGEAPQPMRIVFLGNSITRHGPKPSIGWEGDWGMAASAEAKDYVHLVIDALAKTAGVKPEVRVVNVSEFERNHGSFDLEARLKPYVEFRPHIIVVAIGENVPALKTDEARDVYRSSFTRLLDHLKRGGEGALFVRSSFWANAVKDDIMRQACAAAGGTFVDISHLAGDESNFARSERQFDHAGVAAHPGDKGMKAIAEALVQSITTHLQSRAQR